MASAVKTCGVLSMNTASASMLNNGRFWALYPDSSPFPVSLSRLSTFAQVFVASTLFIGICIYKLFPGWEGRFATFWLVQYH